MSTKIQKNVYFCKTRTYQNPGEFLLELSAICLHDSGIICCNSNNALPVTDFHLVHCFLHDSKEVISRTPVSRHVLKCQDNGVMIDFNSH